MANYFGTEQVQRTAVSDLPVTTLEEDFLSNNRYAKGLCDFICQADTPLTIGIQGGWGSGKTSLLNMLGAGLGQNGAKYGESLCVSINAWQHSLFQANNQGAVAFSLLDGMVRGIERVVDASDHIEVGIKERLKAGKLGSGLITLGKFAGGVAAVGLNMIHHGTVSHLSEAIEGGMQAVVGGEAESPAKAIAELRKKIFDAVQQIVKKGTIKRFVFFVDDLDRVHPQTAVEILDVLKNVFDVPNCVFVLAIDFDVVIKGLEGKFGVRTNDNAREFRQYFDKIIQVPFSMPISAYENAVAKLIGELLKRFNFGDSTEIPIELSGVAWAITDGTPRSIKRIINTLSLLHLIKRGDTTESKDISELGSQLHILSGDELTVWFAVVGMQINFPSVYMQLERTPNFIAWTPEASVSHEATKDELLNLQARQFVANEGLPINFQQTLYLLCQKDNWLRGRESALLSVFSAMTRALKKMENQSEPADVVVGSITPSLEFLKEVLNSASITSLDRAQPVEEIETIRSDEITLLSQKVHKVLTKSLSELEPFEDNKTYAKRNAGLGRGGRRYTISCRCEKKDLIQEIGIDFERGKKNSYAVYIDLWMKAPFGNTAQFREALQDGFYVDASYLKHDGLRVLAASCQPNFDMDAATTEIAEKVKDLLEKTRSHLGAKLGSR